MKNLVSHIGIMNNPNLVLPWYSDVYQFELLHLLIIKMKSHAKSPLLADRDSILSL